MNELYSVMHVTFSSIESVRRLSMLVENRLTMGSKATIRIGRVRFVSRKCFRVKSLISSVMLAASG